METKKPASIKAHQRFGALRIGTLRDHESVALLVCLDACLRCNVARNRKLPNSSQYPNIWLPTKTSEFRRDNCLAGNSAERCRKLTFAGEKLRVSAAQSSITCLLSITVLAIHLPYSIGTMNGIHSNGENNFAATKIKTKIRPGFVSKWRNGPCFRHMAARPHTLSQLWRYLAAQTNVLSAVSRLQFLSGLRTDRGGTAHL